MKTETFSYLPPMTAAQVVSQIEYIFREKLIPAIEYTDRPAADKSYWSMWKLPLFGVEKPKDVLAEIEACKAQNPGCYIKVVGYDSIRQGQVLSFVVHHPDQSTV